MKKVFTCIIVISLLIYICCSFYILFMGIGGINRLATREFAFNLIPFRTIVPYVKALINGNGHAIMNLGGNLLLFFPLGFYLPFFIYKMTITKSYALYIAILIAVIEILQMLTRTGSFDIDDFILNFIGALIGYLICKHTSIRFLFDSRRY